MAEDVVPPWPLQQVLICIAKILPREKLVPQKDLAEMAFKEKRKQEQVGLCSYQIAYFLSSYSLETNILLETHYVKPSVICEILCYGIIHLWYFANFLLHTVIALCSEAFGHLSLFTCVC